VQGIFDPVEREARVCFFVRLNCLKTIPFTAVHTHIACLVGVPPMGRGWGGGGEGAKNTPEALSH